ncbi:MAG: acyl-ACP--UDP-N-acetylglucosamine O-acyltransferase [Alloprevotella sp.]|nr:acyl-ACP--UDP-N-acetylglucosamine O-acyltransferase [Alloprevotella sp.]
MATEISPLAYVHPEARLGENVKVYPFAYIERDVVIGDNCVIMSHASVLEGSVMGADNYIYQNAVIGAVPQSFRYTVGHRTHVRIGQGNRIRENVVIAGGLEDETVTVIGDRNFLMDGVHICHDVQIGDDNVLGIGAQVAGECQLEHHVILSSGVILQHLARVGRYSLIQSGCVVQKDVPPYIILGGNPVSYHGVSAVILEKEGLSERTLRHIANAYRIVYTGNESLEDAVQKIVDQIPGSAEIDNIVSFIRDSKRGIVRRTQ